jgi:hypothetical protein
MTTSPWQTGWQPVPPPPAPPRKKGLPGWAWALIAVGALFLLSCGGLLAFFVHVGSVGPDTKVYLGNEVPARFADTLRELNLLEPGEQIRYFYSDALKDIRDGCYFVSDRKVAVYKKDAATPATLAKFDQIADVQLAASDSTWSDGSITLTLKDGQTVGFPVSSEQGRDKLFFQAIQEKVKTQNQRKPAP